MKREAGTCKGKREVERDIDPALTSAVGPLGSGSFPTPGQREA